MSSHRPARSAPSIALLVAVSLAAGTTARGQATSTKAAPKGKAQAAATTPLDLNRATAEELEATLPGVGPATARKIVAGRPYAHVDDLARAGVPARTIDEIRPLVTVGPPHAAEKPAHKPAAEKPAGTPPAAGTAAPVNINTATLAELETLPGVGPAHAREIVADRPFKSVDDLERVKGMGKARVEALRGLITTAASAPTPAPAPTPTPAPEPPLATKPAPRAKSAAERPAARPTASGKVVNINTATRAELDALPGIGPVKAQAIIEARPFRTIEDIMKVKGIKEGEFAKIKDVITVR